MTGSNYILVLKTVSLVITETSTGIFRNRFFGEVRGNEHFAKLKVFVLKSTF